MDTLFMLYRAQDSVGSGTSRIGLAWSLDGLHFTREMNPVFTRKEMPGIRWNGRADVRIRESWKTAAAGT